MVLPNPYHAVEITDDADDVPVPPGTQIHKGLEVDFPRSRTSVVTSRSGGSHRAQLPPHNPSIGGFAVDATAMEDPELRPIAPKHSERAKSDFKPPLTLEDDRKKSKSMTVVGRSTPAALPKLGANALNKTFIEPAIDEEEQLLQGNRKYEHAPPVVPRSLDTSLTSQPAAQLSKRPLPQPQLQLQQQQQQQRQAPRSTARPPANSDDVVPETQLTQAVHGRSLDSRGNSTKKSAAKTQAVQKTTQDARAVQKSAKQTGRPQRAAAALAAAAIRRDTRPPPAPPTARGASYDSFEEGTQPPFGVVRRDPDDSFNNSVSFMMSQAEEALEGEDEEEHEGDDEELEDEEGDDVDNEDEDESYDDEEHTSDRDFVNDEEEESHYTPPTEDYREHGEDDSEVDDDQNDGDGDVTVIGQENRMDVDEVEGEEAQPPPQLQLSQQRLSQRGRNEAATQEYQENLVVSSVDGIVGTSSNSNGNSTMDNIVSSFRNNSCAMTAPSNRSPYIEQYRMALTAPWLPRSPERLLLCTEGDRRAMTASTIVNRHHHDPYSHLNVVLRTCEPRNLHLSIAP